MTLNDFEIISKNANLKPLMEASKGPEFLHFFHMTLNKFETEGIFQAKRGKWIALYGVFPYVC